MDVRILGPLEVVDDDGPLPLPGGRARALLALLIVRAGEVVSTDRLIDELWGAFPPATARTKLHGLVSALRRALSGERSPGAADLLETRSPGYLLTVEPNRIDAHRFRQLVVAAKGTSPAERAERLQQALDLWRGAALADFAYEPFAQAEIAALEALRLVALEQRIDADLALGRHGDLVLEIEELVGEHPFRERMWAQRMLALYRCGRRAEALDAYRRVEALLTDEFGIEPGADLHDLQRAIARQDPTLDLPEIPLPEIMTAASPIPGEREKAAPEAWLPQSRKPVTVVFAEIARSSPGERETDPEALQRILTHAFDNAATVLTRHGGTVEGMIGGVVVAVFGIPVVHEDDAVRAVRAALELIRGTTGNGPGLRLPPGRGVTVRVGVNSGEVVVGGSGLGSTTAYGDTVEVASRLQRIAASGEALIGDATLQLIAGAAEVRAVELAPDDLHGQKIAAWNLLALSSDTATIPGHETPLVGRIAELDRLRAAFDRSVRERRAELITVVGEAGIGKSRLVRAFAADLVNARVLTGHCPAYGEGITFWPLREIVAQAAGSSAPSALVELLAGAPNAQTLAASLAAATGLSEEPGAPTELFPAVRILFEQLAHSRHLVVIFEDVHWAEATLLDLIKYLAATIRHPVLLISVSRPEHPERRPDRSPKAGDSTPLLLGPLEPQESVALVTAQLAGRVLPREIFRSVVELAQGNPLFLAQMAASFRSDGAGLSLPPSVQALLAARLDRLGPAERDILRCAAVVGRTFSLQALAALVPAETRPFLERHLQTLSDRALLAPTRRSLLGKSGFEFRHALIQLAAYRSVTRQARAELHEGFADWLEEAAGGSLLEFEEVIGYHLEQASEHRRGIGLLDERSGALARRAGERLSAAGGRAFARLDVAAATNLLGRAVALLTADHPAWRPTLQRFAQASQIAGRHSEADAALAELLDRIGPDEDALLIQRIRVERARIRLFTGPDPALLDPIRQEAERAIEAFSELEDHAGVSQAADVLAQVHLRRGRMREMEQVARRGLDHAHRSGAPRQVVAARFWVVMSLLCGPTPVEVCLAACGELLRWQGIEHPLVLTTLAQLQAMLGECDRARELAARARRVTVERLRARRPLMFVEVASAEVEMLAGDPAVAERALRTALELATEMQEVEVVAQVAAALSRQLPAASAEAAQLAELAAERAPAENVHAQAAWRSARARILAGRGQHQAAQRLAREAALRVPVDMPNLRADRLVDLAAVLTTAGRHGSAHAALRQAIALYRRKGNLAGSERAATLIG